MRNTRNKQTTWTTEASSKAALQENITILVRKPIFSKVLIKTFGFFIMTCEIFSSFALDLNLKSNAPTFFKINSLKEDLLEFDILWCHMIDGRS